MCLLLLYQRHYFGINNFMQHFSIYLKKERDWNCTTIFIYCQGLFAEDLPSVYTNLIGQATFIRLATSTFETVLSKTIHPYRHNVVWDSTVLCALPGPISSRIAVFYFRFSHKLLLHSGYFILWKLEIFCKINLYQTIREIHKNNFYSKKLK